jgi:hypothetical protein
MKIYVLMYTHNDGCTCCFDEMLKVFHDKDVAEYVANELNSNEEYPLFNIEEREVFDLTSDEDISNVIHKIKNRYT